MLQEASLKYKMITLSISNRILSVTNFLKRNTNYPNLPDVDAITNAAYVKI